MKYVRYVSVALLLVASLSACSIEPSASPAFAPQAECERNGGWWHTDRGVCEYQGTSDGGGAER
jgi:hypothetical protein